MDELSAALQNLIMHCDRLAAAIEERGLLGVVGDPAIEQERQLTIMALDDAAQKLAEARPSQMAIALGFGW